jgi:hypothetical protein
MGGLADREILEVWEAGRGCHSVERGLALLRVAFPDPGGDDLRALPIGRHDALLLSLLESTFGSTLHCAAQCGSCGFELEFALDTAALRGEGEPDVPVLDSEQSWAVDCADVCVQFRLPNVRDLMAAARTGNAARGRELLIEGVVLAAQRDGVPIGAADLPEEVVEKLGARIAEIDPQVTRAIGVRCPGCGDVGEAELDLAETLWLLLAERARRLLDEIDRLARVYHWREADILTMSPARRHQYLERVGA